MLYDLHEKAGLPTLAALERRIAGDDRLEGSPKKDLIRRIISEGGPAALADVRAVAQTLARACGQDEYAAAARVAQMMDPPGRSPAPQPVLSAYLAQVRWIAPPQLMGREPESAELARFCLDEGELDGSYAWWQAYIQQARAVTWPVRVGVVPPVVHARQDRPADHELADAVARPGAVFGCQVLSGLGGVGKTQVAANLAQRLWSTREVDLLLWLTATSRSDIISGYALAAAATGFNDPDPEVGAARLLAGLAATDQRWLIVLDDLADPDDLTGLWPPTVERGRTVVTTRRRDAALVTGRQVIDVDVFTPAQAEDYLRGKLVAHPNRLDQAGGLAADLGYLPLALAQAAAYILDRGARMTCAAYRQRLADQRRRLGELAPHALPDQHQATVAATWTLSIDRADQLTPAGVARPILQMCALLDPNGIPADLFTSQAVADYCTLRLGRHINGDDVDDAVHLLHRFSLITVDETTATIRVHGLLQRTVRDTTIPDQQRGLAHATADALVEIWPPVERDPAHAQILRTNTTVLHLSTGGHLWTTDEGGHPVLFRAGNSLSKAGLVSAAADYYHQLTAEAERMLGPDHPHSLVTRHNLATRRGTAGDAAGAATALENLVPNYLRVLGPNHPDTLMTRSALAYWRGQTGGAAGAVTALENLVADYLRVLGPDHPDTLTTRHNLTYWRGEAGDAAGAVTALENLVADYLRVLGPDHPDTLTAHGNLAYWRGEAGDAAGAAAAFEQLLADRLRMFGPDHPDTLVARRNLAHWRGRAGDAAGAAAAFEQLLADRLRVLGPDHPNTLMSRGDLAYWRGEAGDAAGAAAAFEQLLADYLRVLGPDHPHSLTARSNLAHWRGEAGDAAGAATAFEQLLADRLRVLGPDHPNTLTTRHNLAHWRGRAGDQDRRAE